MTKKVLSLKKTAEEKSPKNKKVLSLKSDREKKTEKLEDLNERIADLTETQRQQESTAKKISDALQEIVDQQNEEAIGYRRDFDNRLQEKTKHKIRKKYFPGKKQEEILLMAKNNPEIQNKFKEYRNEYEKKENIGMNRTEKKEIFNAIKRVFQKNITGHKGNDIDKEGCKMLLSFAKFFTNQQGEKIPHTENEVDHRERAENGLQYDSGGTFNGMEIIPNKQTIRNGKSEGKTYLSLFNALAILDEHDRSEAAKNEKKTTSSTHMIYTLLDKLNVFHPNYKEQIKRFVDFIDKVDSLYYQVGGMDQNAKKRTLFHNHKLIPIQRIYNYFADKNHTGFEILSEGQLNELGITNTKYNEKRDQKNIQKLQELEDKGRIGNIEKLKFIFAIGREFTGGQEIASYYGSGIVQLFESGDLYIYNPFPLPKTIGGFPTNEHFLIIKNIEPKDLEKVLDSFEFHSKYSDPLLKKSFLGERKKQLQEKTQAVN